jgi:hypothetical protein
LYLDYGAFAHVIGKVGNFNNVKRMVDFASVKFVVGHTHKVYGKGNVVVACQGEIKTMNNVFYVLGIKRNLLLVRVVVNMGYVAMFGKQTCWIVVVITLHKLLAINFRAIVNGLYKLEITMPPKHEQPTSLLILVE